MDQNRRLSMWTSIWVLRRLRWWLLIPQSSHANGRQGRKYDEARKRSFDTCERFKIRSSQSSELQVQSLTADNIPEFGSASSVVGVRRAWQTGRALGNAAASFDRGAYPARECLRIP